MRIAILGGTGSIGMATAAHAAQRGVDVTVLSRRPPDGALPDGVDWLPVDVVDASSVREALAKQRIDRVLHLAATLQFACESDPASAIRVNVDGTLHVLEACRDLGIPRLVYGSSIAVYGERSDPMREDDPPPSDMGLYGFTKRLGERLGERFHALHGLDFAALRYSGIIGPGLAMTAGMARVRNSILACASGRDMAIEGASGDEHSHLTFLEDAAEATCVALLSPRPLAPVYNVAGPPENYVSLRELHALVRDLVPGSGRAIWSGHARSSGPADVSRIAKDLGWKPSVGLHAGLRRMFIESRQIPTPVD